MALDILFFHTVPSVMLVKALRLRYLGHRIPADILRQEAPMVGDLSYSDHLHGRSMSCLLMPLGGDTEPLVQLFSCRIKIERRGLLIRGEEHLWRRKHRESYPQTVWAWPIPPEAMSNRSIPPSHFDTEELRAAIAYPHNASSRASI
jgi:hypothetical protein